jgi:hypothetical protein
MKRSFIVVTMLSISFISLIGCASDPELTSPRPWEKPGAVYTKDTIEKLWEQTIKLPCRSGPFVNTFTGNLGTANIQMFDEEWTVPELRPGNTVTLQGGCFGKTPGDVGIKLHRPDRDDPSYHLLEVLSWTPNQIEAQLPNNFQYVPPSWGNFVVKDSMERISDWVVPLFAFTPRFVEYVFTWEKSVSGGATGSSKNGLAYGNQPCFDFDYFIVAQVSSRHSGNGGWSKLQEPWATRHCMKQGWHIGMSAFKQGQITIYHHVVAPKGMVPASLSGVPHEVHDWEAMLPQGEPTIPGSE